MGIPGEFGGTKAHESLEGFTGDVIAIGGTAAVTAKVEPTVLGKAGFELTLDGPLRNRKERARFEERLRCGKRYRGGRPTLEEHRDETTVK